MHICTHEEITQKKYDDGMLHICMSSDLKLYNNYEFMPYWTVKFEVKPNYEKDASEDDKKAVNAEINNFSLAKLNINSEINLNIINDDGQNKGPVKSTIKFLGHIPIELGYIQHLDSTFRLSHFTDITDWIQFG